MHSSAAEVGGMAEVGGVLAALRFARDPNAFFRRTREERGDLVRGKSFGQEYVFVFDPRSVELVLGGGRGKVVYGKDRFLKSWSQVVGWGLLTSEGEIWRKQRLQHGPAFHRAAVDSYEPAIEGAILRLCESWERQGEGALVDLHASMVKLALDIVCRALFGTLFSERELERLGELFAVFATYHESTLHPAGFVLRRFPTPKRRRYLKARRELDQVIARLQGKGPEASGCPFHGARFPRDQVATLLLAGHETVALTLMNAFRELSAHPEHQHRLSDRRDPSDFFLKQVIQEVLRLHPPAWSVSREALVEDCIAGQPIRAGTTVVIPVREIQRDPRYYPDSETFRPERWTPAFSEGLPAGAYLPFGLGPRSCIGGQLAMRELTLVIQGVLARFELEAVERGPVKLRFGLTARPAAPVRIRLKRRGRSDAR